MDIFGRSDPDRVSSRVSPCGLLIKLFTNKSEMTSVGVLYTLSFIMDILEKGDLNGGVIHLVEGFFHDK